MRTYKRRTILIQPTFQIKQAVIMIALFALSAFLVWWETYQSLGNIVERGLVSDPNLMTVVQQISHVVLIKVTLALGLVSLLSILLTHLVAGPVYRLQKGLEALRDGDFSQRIHLRRFDELKNLAEIFNEAMDRLQSDKAGKK